MSRSYQEVTPAGATYPVAPQVSITFEPTEVWLIPLSGAGNDAVYSFDGVNDHGKVFGTAAFGSAEKIVVERIRAHQVWLRILLGAPVVAVAGKTDV